MSAGARKVLVVEDDPGIQSQVRWALGEYQAVPAEDRQQALAELRRHEPPVVILDLGLPPDSEGPGEGFTLLGEILELAPHTKVIVVTGCEASGNGVRAIGMGAYDFYTKPVDPEALGLIVERAFHVHDLEAENRRLARQAESSPLGGLITASPVMEEVCRQVEKLAPSGATTCILGESGTGKELVARALHELSDRSGARFAAINCAAIPESLLESELFGYEKGAFTGANERKPGQIEHAHGGTLFLDEIGDLPASLQGKLLRFLQERVVERVGGREEIPVDVRVVSATNRDLEQLIQEGAFREDLYYRLCEVAIRIPPLREREGDASLIARSLLAKHAGEQHRKVVDLSEDALAAVDSYSWPGNVRELENRIKRAVIMAEGPQITARDLELEATEGESFPLNLRHIRDQAERQAVLRALHHSGNNLSRAAELLGVTRPTLYSLLDKYGLREGSAGRRGKARGKE